MTMQQCEQTLKEKRRRIMQGVTLQQLNDPLIRNSVKIALTAIDSYLMAISDSVRFANSEWTDSLWAGSMELAN